MKYKNISSATLTFYGVTIGPGEVKELSGAVNAPQLFPTDEPVTQPQIEAPAAPANEKRSTKATTTQKKEASSDGSNSD